MISSAVRILLFVHSRTVRDILADRPPLNFHTAARLKLPLANTAQHRRTVHGPLADRPQCIFAVENFSAEPLVNKSLERRTVRLLPADCPHYQISDSPEFFKFHNFNFELGSLLI